MAAPIPVLVRSVSIGGSVEVAVGAALVEATDIVVVDVLVVGAAVVVVSLVVVVLATRVDVVVSIGAAVVVVPAVDEVAATTVIVVVASSLGEGEFSEASLDPHAATTTAPTAIAPTQRSG